MRGAVRRSVLALAGLVLFGSTWPALADWAGFRDYVAIAEVRVEEESIRVEIRLRENGLPGYALCSVWRLRLLFPRLPDRSCAWSRTGARFPKSGPSPCGG